MNSQHHNQQQPLPVVGITMGDPVGIGPEILCKALLEPRIYEWCRPLAIGDADTLEAALRLLKRQADINPVRSMDECRFTEGGIDLITASKLKWVSVIPGEPTPETSRGMLNYIETGIDLAIKHRIDALVTCPITKTAMKLAGSEFHGHTELLAARTNAGEYAMMMAGDRLRVVLVTIHMALSRVPASLTRGSIVKTIRMTHQSLEQRFGIRSPKIAVAGLNPHAGEDTLFGAEEGQIIRPAVETACSMGFEAAGPLPPDTVFYQALNQKFDAVVCMYHDQGLIPFKLIHFKDGVNTTIGLPIIRTSVDHGTAYDIAGEGVADHSSLMAAIRMAAFQASSQESTTSKDSTI